MSFTSGNDLNVLQATHPTILGAGLGDDRYVLDASLLAPNQRITLSDSQGTNTLHLVGGLHVVSSKVGSNALLLTLSNGALITVLGANTFKYQTGGNPLTGSGALLQGFSDFVTQALKVSVPAPGAALVSGNGVIVNQDGSTAAATSSNDQVLLGTASNDSLTGNAGNDNISGLAGNDTLDGAGGNDTLLGGNGDDRLIGGAGNDTLDGGADYDSVEYQTSPSAVNVNLALGTAQDGNGGTDTLINIEGVVGSAHNDRLTGGNPANGTGATDGYESFRGGAGNDTIDGGGGYDDAEYTTSSQGIVVKLEGAGSGTAQDGLGSTDTLINIEGVRGSNFNDQLTGSSSAYFEQFQGLGGNDTIDGGAAPDSNHIRRANYVNSPTGVTVILGGQGQGIAQDGFGGTDTLRNINFVRGSNRFNDTLMGSDTTAFVESFEGRGGNDTIDGKGGEDIVRYQDAAASVTVNLALGTAQDGDGGTDTLANIEGVRGSRYNDLLIGGNPANGSGVLDGLEFFRGEAGNDTIDGGAGYDRAEYETATQGVVVTLGGTGTGTAQDGQGGIDTLISIEAVRGGDFADRLTGSDSAAFESFEGMAGDDTLEGGAGADEFDGGAGNDLFIVGAGDSGLTLDTADVIKGFVSGSDRLGLGVAATAANYQEAGIASANFSAALAAANAAFASDAGGAKAYVFQFDGTNGYLFIDRGANGATAEEVIVLAGINSNGFALTDIVA